MELREAYDKLMAAINQIDVELDSLTGEGSSIRRRIVNDLVEKHGDVFNPAIASIVENIKNLPDEQRIAAVNAFVNTIRKEFGKSTEAILDTMVAAAPKQQPLITEEQAEVRQKQRSELYQKVKSIVELAASVFDEGEWDMPPMRRGSTGKRGPRNLSLFTFFIDGAEVDMTIGQIAKENGYEKAADLTKALREKNEETGWKGFDTREGEKFDGFKLPNGKILAGVRPADDEDDPEDDPEDEIDPNSDEAIYGADDDAVSSDD